MPDTQTLIREEARRQGVPEDLALAVADQESSLNPATPPGPTLPTGERAIGLYQILPSTAQPRGFDPTDPYQNLKGGIGYLRELLDKHRGDRDAVLREYGGVRTDTSYVPGVLARLKKFQPTTPSPAAPAAQVAPPSPAKTARGPSTATTVSRVGSPLVGALGGALTGAELGAPAGPFGSAIGALAGAGGGAGLGELVQAGWERLIGQPPPSHEGLVSRVGQATQTGMTGEATGQIVGKVGSAVVRPLLAPFAKKLEPFAREAMATFKGSTGAPAVLPAEVTNSRLLDVAQNVAEGSLLGGSRIAAIKEARQGLAEQKVLDTLKSLGPTATPSEAGEAVLSGRQAAIRQFRAQERPKWDTFKTLVKDVPAHTPHLDAFIGELTGQEAGRVIPSTGVTVARRVAALSGAPGSFAEPVVIGGKALSADELRALPSSVQQAVQSALGAPPGPTLSAAQFQTTVSNLGALSRRLERAAITDPTRQADAGLVKHLYGLAQDDLGEMAATAGPEAVAAHEDARLFSRLGQERLFHQDLRSLTKKAPEQVTDAILKRNKSTAINAVKQAVAPEDFAQVQSVAMQRILEPNSRTGRLNWGEVASRIDRYGDETMNALFPGGHAKDVRKVAGLMQELAQKKTGVGKLAIQFRQAGAITAGGSALIGHPEATAAILLTPSIMARVFANPVALKWLSTGLEAPTGSTTAITAATQLAAFLQRESAQEQEEPSVVGTPPPMRAQGPGPVGTPPPGGSESPISRTLQKYPLLRKLGDVNVVDSRTRGMQDDRQLEYYAPDEQDNPQPGKPTVEIFNPALRGQAYDDAVAADLLHGLKAVDPQWRQLRQQIIALRSPQNEAIDQRAYAEDKAHGETRSFDQWMEDSRADAYVRGYLFPDAADEWRRGHVYNDRQKQVLEQMRRRLTAPEQVGSPPPR